MLTSLVFHASIEPSARIVSVGSLIYFSSLLFCPLISWQYFCSSEMKHMRSQTDENQQNEGVNPLRINSDLSMENVFFSEFTCLIMTVGCNVLLQENDM